MLSVIPISSSYFYSRPREGGDALKVEFETKAMLFLFTPPRRGRRKRGKLGDRKLCYFYSRPREGGDGIEDEINKKLTIFLFTPPRRGRQHTFIIFISICVQLLSIMHNAISLLFIFRT